MIDITLKEFQDILDRKVFNVFLCLDSDNYVLNKPSSSKALEFKNNIKTPKHIKHQKNNNIQKWSNEDYKYQFYERAGILEYDGNLRREEAEIKALNGIILLYSKNNGLDIGDKGVNDFIISFLEIIKFNN